VLVQLKRLDGKNLDNLAERENEKPFFTFYFSLFGFRFSRENRKIVFSGWLLQSAVLDPGFPKSINVGALSRVWHLSAHTVPDSLARLDHCLAATLGQRVLSTGSLKVPLHTSFWHFLVSFADRRLDPSRP